METLPSPTKSRHLRYYADIINEVLDLDDPKQAMTILRAIIEAVTTALQREDQVYVQGFGTFYVHKPSEWIHRKIILHSPPGSSTNNVYSPVLVKLPGKKRVFFQPSVQLLAMLNPDDNTFVEKRAKSIWSKP